MTAVTPNIIVAGFEESFEPRLRHATHVLNVASECEVSERVGRTYAKHAIRDDDERDSLLDILDACLEFIAAAHASGGTVIVHCLEGKSRSVAVALAYMAVHQGDDFWDAYERVRLLRPVVDVFPKYLREAAAFRRHPHVRLLPSNPKT
jgi:protein-tyrosine phosphatase